MHFCADYLPPPARSSSDDHCEYCRCLRLNGNPMRNCSPRITHSSERLEDAARVTVTRKCYFTRQINRSTYCLCSNYAWILGLLFESRLILMLEFKPPACQSTAGRLELNSSPAISSTMVDSHRRILFLKAGQPLHFKLPAATETHKMQWAWETTRV